MELIEFETERLRLRQWRASDYGPFAAINADAKAMQFFPCRLDRQESDALAETIRCFIARRNWGFWAVEVKAGEPFIGFVGLNVPTAALPCSPCVEIGWRLAASHWGRGYAFEAARGALRVAFEQLKLSEIVSFTPAENRPSRRVMERIGMQHSGETFEHPGVSEPGPLRTLVLYRLLREQWRDSDRPCQCTS